MRTKQLKMPFMAVVILCLMASNPEPLSSQAIESHSLNRSVLWKIDGIGLKAPSYLFGTVHILDSSKFFLSETMIEQLSKCQAVVFESNIDEPGYQQKALQYSYMKNDSLENILSENEYEDLNQFFKTEFNFHF